MTTPLTPSSGYAVNGAQTIFEYPPITPGINTSNAPTNAQITTPTFPATTVAATNTNTVDVVVYALAGAAGFTVVKVNGVTTGLVTAASASCTIYLPVGATISFTYASGTPTWVWMPV